MPIEVRELVIKATIEDASSNNTTLGKNGSLPNSSEEIVKLCIEKVMEILKKEKER